MTPTRHRRSTCLCWPAFLACVTGRHDTSRIVPARLAQPPPQQHTRPYTRAVHTEYSSHIHSRTHSHDCMQCAKASVAARMRCVYGHFVCGVRGRVFLRVRAWVCACVCPVTPPSAVGYSCARQGIPGGGTNVAGQVFAVNADAASDSARTPTAVASASALLPSALTMASRAPCSTSTFIAVASVAFVATVYADAHTCQSHNGHSLR